MLDSEPCDWLVLPLLLLTPIICFHWIISDGVISGIGRKWKRSDSSNSDSVELMTPLTTLFFNFHLVISALTSPTTTPTPTLSLVKTSLKKTSDLLENCNPDGTVMSDKKYQLLSLVKWTSTHRTPPPPPFTLSGPILKELSHGILSYFECRQNYC